jgi:glutamate/tyrosine decarboxylase-like PLP-dependent enzyme
VERNIASAVELGDRLARSNNWRLLAPVRLNVVCFTLAQDATKERIRAALDAATHTGEVFLTPTVYKGVPAIRAAFSNWRTTATDVERVSRALGV